MARNNKELNNILVSRINKVNNKVNKEKKKNRKAKKLWEELGDIPIDEDECIDEDWRYFDKGTHIYDIWHWFEEEFNLSVSEDLMGIK